MKVFALGFLTVLGLAGAVFLACWKYLDRMERAYGYRHAR